MDEKKQTPFQEFQALAKNVIRVPKPEVDQRIRAERATKLRQNSAFRKGGK